MFLPTIKVVYKPGKYEMIINESDFDEKIHEKIGIEKPAKAEKSAKTKVEKSVDDEELKNLIGEE